MASIYERPNGSYCVRVYAGTTGGKQKLVSKSYYPPQGMSPAAIQKDLQRFTRSIGNLVHSGRLVPGSRTDTLDARAGCETVADFIRNFYYQHAESNLSPNTARFYRNTCEQIIIPHFGELKLAEINRQHLKNMSDYLHFGYTENSKVMSMSPETVRCYCSVFRSVMNLAEDYNFVEINPFEGFKLKVPKQKKTLSASTIRSMTYGKEEVIRFLGALREEDPLTRIYLTTALMTGLRRAEAVALQWNDVDFERGCLYVTKSAYKLPDKPQALKSPKSENGCRAVYFSPQYAEELRLWKDVQEQMKAKAGENWHEQDFIFTSEDGDMISLYTPTRLCERFEEKHGLRHLKLHGLRHTYVSQLAANGVDPFTIKELVGHSSVTTTEIYTHPINENKIAAANCIGNLLSIQSKQ